MSGRVIRRKARSSFALVVPESIRGFASSTYLSPPRAVTSNRRFLFVLSFFLCLSACIDFVIILPYTIAMNIPRVGFIPSVPSPSQYYGWFPATFSSLRLFASPHFWTSYGSYNFRYLTLDNGVSGFFDDGDLCPPLFGQSSSGVPYKPSFFLHPIFFVHLFLGRLPTQFPGSALHYIPFG